MFCERDPDPFFLFLSAALSEWLITKIQQNATHVEKVFYIYVLGLNM